MENLINLFIQTPLGPWGTLFAILCAVLVLWLAVSSSKSAKENRELFEKLQADITARGEEQRQSIAKNLNENLNAANSLLRQEFTQSVSELSRTQNQSLVNFADLIQKMNQGNATVQLQAREALKTQVSQLSSGINQELAGIRDTLNRQLQTLQTNNDAKLELMRQTVETKLQSTLETRLTESFKQVAGHLKEVETGLGEMRAIAGQVGELKRVLTNVKTRGTFGEVQLGAILANMIPNHYEENVATRPKSNDRVEFAIKLPGQNEGESVWLPVDSKFPVEDYQKIEDAREAGDAEAAERHAKAFEMRIKSEAKKIHEKYVEVPYTTEFAVMFLPSEAIYAELHAHFTDVVEVSYRSKVWIVSPTTLMATLNTVRAILKDAKMREQAGVIQKEVGILVEDIERLDSRVDNLSKHFKQAGEDIENIKISSSKIGRRIQKIEDIELGESAQVEVPKLANDG